MLEATKQSSGNLPYFKRFLDITKCSLLTSFSFSCGLFSFNVCDMVLKTTFLHRLVWWKLFVYPLALLLFYPVVPLLLTAAFLITNNEKTLEKAVMSKYFTAFLDHGPQFVLRLVIVVLVGIAQNGVYNR